MTTITNLRCEYRTNLLGIDVMTPRFSWQMQTERTGAGQTTYRVLAASDPALLHAGQRTRISADFVGSSYRLKTDSSTQRRKGAKAQSRSLRLGPFASWRSVVPSR